MPTKPLTKRALNRATLARQMLLVRETKTPLATIEQLAGMQAQLPRPPFIGLWSRLEDFKREDLRALLDRRKVVRATMMRATIHLVSTKDFLKLRPSLNSFLAGSARSALRNRTNDLDIDAVVAAAREHFTEGPRTFEEVRDFLSTRFPNGDIRAMGYLARLSLPLVMTPADHSWGYSESRFAFAESFLGKPMPLDEDPGPLLLRYFAAFGPASVADVQTWSGLRAVRTAVEALRPKLRTFHDEQGRELFDLPDAPRPSEDTPAPVRFLPDYDNLLLAYNQRRRIIDESHKTAVFLGGLTIPATILVDGFVAGTWRIERQKKRAVLSITPFGKLARRIRDELSTEGDRLVRFVEPQAADFDVRFAG